MSTFKLNQAATDALSQVAMKAGLNPDQALGAALAVAKDTEADDLKKKAEGQEEADSVSGRDWIRVSILGALFLLMMGAVVLSLVQVAPREINLQSATDICKASADATGAKTCDPATVLSTHRSEWQSSLLALVAALFTPVLALFSASVGYYFGKGGGSSDVGGG
jgi:predicted metalloprotease